MVAALCLLLGSQTALAPTATGADDPRSSVGITKTNDTGGKPLEPGDEFVRAINGQCTGLTVDCVDFTVTDTLPEGLDVTSLPQSTTRDVTNTFARTPESPSGGSPADATDRTDGRARRPHAGNAAFVQQGNTSRHHRTRRKEDDMDDYPLLNLFLTMLFFFLWITWLFLLFRVVMDVFRDDDLSGWGKAGWLLFCIVLPYLGVLVYVVARGRGMGRRDVRQAKETEAAVQDYIRKTAAEARTSGEGGTPSGGTSSGGTPSGGTDELVRLSGLRDSGALTQEEFDRAKTKLLA